MNMMKYIELIFYECQIQEILFLSDLFPYATGYDILPLVDCITPIFNNGRY